MSSGNSFHTVGATKAKLYPYCLIFEWMNKTEEPQKVYHHLVTA